MIGAFWAGMIKFSRLLGALSGDSLGIQLKMNQYGASQPNS
jgi:hypothetical protein